MNYFHKKHCLFCQNEAREINYFDTQLLRRYLTIWSKIKPAKSTGTCTKHQRRLAEAIKRARFLALLPYVKR